MKNFAPDFTKEKLEQELINKNFQFLRIHQFRNYREKTFIPVFLIDLKKTDNAKEIYNIKYIDNLKIKVEDYRPKKKATMCYRCSGFFHSARNCQLKPKFIKCNAEHETRDCQIKEKLEIPYCVTCQEKGHIASWLGCPKYPKPKSKISYAQTLKKNLTQNKPETAKEVTPQTLKANEELNEFEQKLNAIRIINNAMKKFPNLIQVSQEILNAKSDLEIVRCLLKIIPRN